ncbi:MAG: AMP-binding protein [Rhodopseudomonas palustris]|nr:AMP-binding protein [Rhodopseudomonas palustris]
MGCAGAAARARPCAAACGDRAAPRRHALWRPTATLADYPTRITDCLLHWAAQAPDRVFLAERDRNGRGWRTLSYAQMLQAARRIASALLTRPLSADRPVMMLSGNSLDHAQLAFGALYAGMPHVPVSPQYSLLSTDFAKLGEVISAADAGPGVCRGRQLVRRGAAGARAAGCRNRRLARCACRPQAHALR